MKRIVQGVVVAAALLTGTASFAQSDTGTRASGGMAGSRAQGMGGTTQKGMSEHMGFMVPTDEKSLLERLHYSNQQEIKLAQLAQKNAQSPDVKSFADMMVKDHTALDQKLMSYAQGKGLKLADMPRAMNDMEKRAMAQDKAAMEELQVLRGGAFDSCYMAGQVSDHDAVLGKVMAARQAMPAAGGELATLLTETTQRVSTHRDQAWNILGRLDDNLGVGGSGTMNNGSGHMGGSMEHGKMNHGGTGNPPTQKK